jgi:hypothetical protein
MTPEEKIERDSAKEAYSESQKTLTQIRKWYRRLKAPTPNDELIWLATKANVSKTYIRYQEILDRLEGDEMNSRLPDTSGESVTDRVSNILASVRTTPNSVDMKEIRKQERIEENIEKRRDIVINLIESGSSYALASIDQLDKHMDEKGWVQPWGVSLNKEEWEAFKKEHPPKPPLVADLDTEPEPQMPAPVKSTRPVFDEKFNEIKGDLTEENGKKQDSSKA